MINASEGRDPSLLGNLAGAAGQLLLDLHADSSHNRAVLTLGGPASAVEEAARSVARKAVELLDLRRHEGVHPRIGALDVVPFVSLKGWPVHNGPLAPALAARNSFASWAGEELGLPCFLYGPERSLPEVRRRAWDRLLPEAGPPRPHPSAGACAVGARPVLVAYNLWLSGADLPTARRLAAELRSPQLRALGLAVDGAFQVSCNLIDPWSLGPAQVFDAVARRAEVDRAELVGLLPSSVLQAIPRHRWRELDLAESRTIEARLEEAGLDGGRP